MKRTLQFSTSYLKRMVPCLHLNRVQPLTNSPHHRALYPIPASALNNNNQTIKFNSTGNNNNNNIGRELGSPVFQTVRRSSATAQARQPEAPTPSDRLPRLPVPNLNDTLTKFLRSVKPLLSPAEYERTLSVVKEFGSDGGVGQKLNQLLEERAKTTENWLSDWWLRNAYLEFRDPVVVYSSPGLVFPLEDFQSKEDQLRYAAKLIYGALCYKQSIDDGTVQPDMMGKLPLDMSQYHKVIGTIRTPGKTKDTLFYYPKSKHFVVAYKNFFYKVNGYSESGYPLTPSELLHQLKYVMELSALGSMGGLPGIPVGILTASHRDVWGQSYGKLVKDRLNQESVQIISEALFLVSIDQPNRPLKSPKGSTDVDAVEDLAKSEKQTVAALQMIHGNRANSGNRWFDKTIQFIIGSEGECGLTYEHSPAEGPPIANLMDFIVGNLKTYEPLVANYIESKEPPKNLPIKLKFNIDSKASTAITLAKENLDALITDLDMACFTFKKYGKDFIKSCNFSPDSYIQMAIQSAFHRVHGIPGAHYESASTRMFVGGRTETIRSCSSESLEFAEALNSKLTCSPQEKYKLMKKAIEGHKIYAADAVRGRGVDRHLLGLKLIAQQNGITIPELYTDKGFIKSSHFRLSTSQVASVNQAFMCYGPLVPNGYGCCYNPTKNEMSFGISAMNSSSETNSGKFKIALQEVLLDMQKLAAQNIPSKL